MWKPRAGSCGGVVVQNRIAGILAVRRAIVNQRAIVVAVTKFDAVRIELVVGNAYLFGQCFSSRITLGSGCIELVQLRPSVGFGLAGRIAETRVETRAFDCARHRTRDAGRAGLLAFR